ncbi:MAG: GTPase [Candidatus Shikimatogenerans sp. AspAUS03]|uniref:GTPase n=1 Tax=Candidatus Shikimatogenerans sp. AspAUS03 TaxID=3158563 RepID=A0AAU7QSW8_9FLAO
MKIIILGRSNVGKSTLFNRIINKNKAIIYNKKYITKDLNQNVFKWNNKYHYISDSGGISFKNDIINNLINKKIFNNIIKYDIIFFLLSFKDGLSINDKCIYNILLRYNKKIFVIVNKVDNNYNYKLYDFYNLGINKLYFISAVNNTGINKILNKALNFKNIKSEKNNKFENKIISIIGKQNVGKSTLFNTLLNKPQNIICKKKGTTIDYIKKKINIYKTKYILYDTPGILKKKKKIDNIIFKKTIKIIKKSNICLFIIDITTGFSKEDYYILNICKKYFKPIIFIYNKINLIKNENFNFIKKYEIKKINNIFTKYFKTFILFINAKMKYKYNYKIIKYINIIYQNIYNNILTKKKNIYFKNNINDIFFKKKKIIINIHQIFNNKYLIIKIIYCKILLNKNIKKKIILYFQKKNNYIVNIQFVFKKYDTYKKN